MFYKRFSALTQVKHAQAAIVLIAVAVLLLSGCSTTRVIDSDVTAFSKAAIAPGSTYRFERLPSQQVDTKRQDQIEAMVQAALDKVKLQRVGDAPGSPKARYSVQLTLAMQARDRSYYWDDRSYRPIGSIGVIGVPGGGAGSVSVTIGSGPYWSGWGGYPYGYTYPAPPYYVRDIAMLLRDTTSNQVVYETRARHEGPWADSAAILPAMLDAALQGFPTPPAGPRQVRVEIPR
jgi:predicted small secreted protein